MTRLGLHQLAQSAAADGDIPTWDDAAGLWVPSAPSGGGSVPTSRLITAGTGLTGGGDLSADRTLAIDTTAEAERIRDTIGSALVAGTNMTVTVNDAGDTITLAAAGGASDPFVLNPGSLNGTYGEHFTGAALPAGWSRVGSYVSGDEAYQQGGGSWLKTAARTPGSYYYRSAPSGDFSLVMSAIYYTNTSAMFGIICVDNTGAGVAGGWYNGSPNGPITAQLNTSTAYNGVSFTQPASSTGPRGTIIGDSGHRVWYKLTRVGNNWTTRLSLNGLVWSPPTTALGVTFTPTRIGFGCFFGGATIAEGLAVDFLDVQ